MLQINLKGVVNTSGDSNIAAGNCFIVGAVNERTLMVIDKNGIIGRVGMERVTVLPENNPSINNNKSTIKEIEIEHNQSKGEEYVVIGSEKGYLDPSLIFYSNMTRLSFIKHIVKLLYKRC